MLLGEAVQLVARIGGHLSRKKDLPPGHQLMWRGYAALGTSLRSVERVRQRFVEEGLESAINPKPQTRYRSKKLDGAGEAFLVATACSKAPDGQSDWTLQLLADRLIECNITDDVSYETIRRTLKKTNLNRG